MRALPTLLVLVSLPTLAAGLNDTGVTQCYDGTTLVTCSGTNTGDAAAYPRQDARFGRDPAAGAGQLTKTGGGAAGFDFTPLDASGAAIPLDGNGHPSTPPACVHDNVTNLTWEVKTADSVLHDKTWTYTWYDGATGALGTDTCGGTLSYYSNQCNTNNYVQAVNAAGLCGISGHAAWRVPTRRELLSIVDRGTNSPAIDTNFFPNTVSDWYWTSDIYQPLPAYAWIVYFGDGGAGAYFHSSTYHVRLVRSGQ